MIKVHLNSGNLIIFEKGKVTFGKEHLYITYGNIIYQRELKNVYKVVEVMEDCNSLQRELYRGYLLKRGIEVNVVREAIINKEGEVKKCIYY